MASQSDNTPCCPICCEVFKDPILLPCSHNFCKACWQHWWAENPNHECPVCRRVSALYDPPQNLKLQNLCEALKNFCCIDEAVCNYKLTLRELLKPLKEKLGLLKDIKYNFDQTTTDIEAQAEDTERQIKDVFGILHQYLKEEEQARIAALMEEKQQKSQMVRGESEALDRQISFLSDTINATEKEMEAEDSVFLENYKAAAERVQNSFVDDSEQTPGALIDKDKHLKNLSLEVVHRMIEMIATGYDSSEGN